MKENLKDILFKLYEIEGLVLVAIDREVKIPEILPLIKERYQELAKDLDSLTVDSDSEIHPDPAATEAEEEIIPDEINSEESVESDPSNEADEEPENSELSEALETSEESELPEALETSEDSEDSDDMFYSYVIEDENEVVSPVVPKRKEDARNAMPVFSLNDKFLFIRELFGGDAAAFNGAMAKVGSMSSPQEAESYLINEFDIDPETENGERFLATVRSYF